MSEMGIEKGVAGLPIPNWQSPLLAPAFSIDNLIAPYYPTVPALSIQGAAAHSSALISMLGGVGQTGNFLDVGYAGEAGTRANIASDGSIGIGLASQTWTPRLTIASRTTGYAFSVNNAAMSSLCEFGIGSGGSGTTPSNVIQGASNAGASLIALRIVPGRTDQVGTVNIQFASQTADMEQWQNSSAAILLAITAAGRIAFGSTGDTNLYRNAADQLKTDDKLLAALGIGVGNAAAATIGVGVLANKFEVFDASGASIGFVPVYATIT